MSNISARIKCSILTIFGICFACFCVAKTKIAAGPVVGHTTQSSTNIWFMVKNLETATIYLINQNNPKDFHKKEYNTKTTKTYGKHTVVTALFEELNSKTTYKLSVKIGQDSIGFNTKITTLSENTTEDFSFLVGSCALSLKGVFKPLYSVLGEKIFDSMAKDSADFMVWLGDNVYYLGNDYRSFGGMFYRQLEKRKMKKLARFFSTGKPQYAIWDDHDFGSNNSKSDNALKEEALEIQKLFWPNPYYGTKETKGAFSYFSVYDADFFLLDDRFYKTEENAQNRTLLGEMQLKWFLEKLAQSKATFKFIALGSQVIAQQPHECYGDYPEEKEKIFSLIKEHNIKGVVFLSGDIHHTVLSKADSVYDFTCSPLTAPVYRMKNVEEIYKETMVDETLCFEKNYGKITVSGTDKNRKCTLQIFSKNGDKLWEKEVRL